MNYLFVRSHPYDGSWNVACINAMAEEAKKKGYGVKITDLIADGFNPTFTVEDLAAWREHTFVDPMVKEYQKDIMWADVLVFVFPIWWGAMPAILKGYLDKVLGNGFSFTVNPDGTLKFLLEGKEAIIIATMQYPEEEWKLDGRLSDPLHGIMEELVCHDNGIGVKAYKTFHQMSTIVKGKSDKSITAGYIQECVDLID